jgi:hypothetical protein
MRPPTKTPAPLRFDDLDGSEFERLVFAYHVRTEPAYAFEWYGQAGKDHGRDIVGIRKTQDNLGSSFLITCANWRDFTVAKATNDLNASIASKLGVPHRVRFVTGSRTIPASHRDAIKTYCETRRVYDCEIWSSTEFEEHLRAKAENLLRRLFNGEDFPDGVEDLVQFSRNTPPANDVEVLIMLARALDRPAFTDYIAQESSLPAFRQAIEDAICVINTGMWKTRDGAIIAQLPSKHEISSQKVRTALDKTVIRLRALRTKFDDALRCGNLRPCECGQIDCPIYFMSDRTALGLEATRGKVLQSFRLAVDLASQGE